MAAQTPPAITVAFDENYPPYVLQADNGEAEGYLVDLWRLWERHTGITVHIVSRPWAEAQQMVLNGQADVLEGILQTPDRKLHYDFSATPYSTTAEGIYTLDTIAGIHNYKALEGFQVGVPRGDACVERLLKNGITNLYYLPGNDKTVAALLDGTVTIACLDKHVADFYGYKKGAGAHMRMAFEMPEEGLYRAVRKGNSATLDMVAAGMAKISPAELQEIERKWMGQPFSMGPYLPFIYGGIGLIALLVLGMVFWVHALRAAVTKKTLELARQKDNLRESEERFRAMVEDSALPAVLLENHRLAAPNKAAIAFLGMTNPLQLIGLKMDNISPYMQANDEPSLELFEAAVKIALDRGSYSLPWEFIRVDGTPVFAQVLLTRIQLRGVAVLHCAWFDMTEHRTVLQRMQLELSALKRRLRVPLPH